MTVSYVVNAFGKRDHLRRVLAAIRSQRGIAGEQIVVVDPRSPDDVGALAEELLRDHPDALVLRCPDRGPSHSVNAGAARATRPYLHVLDGDDVLAPFATRFLIDALERFGVGAALGQGGFYRSEDELVFAEADDAAAAFVPRSSLQRMIRLQPSNMSGTLFRTDFFRAIGGCDERIFVHDFSVSLRACRAGRVAFSDAVLWRGPLEDPRRIMNAQKRQMLHDFNAALYYLLLDHPDLPLRLKMLALRRAAGRARKWARREEGRPFHPKYLALDALAQLPAVPAITALLRATLGAFELSHPVRKPLSPASHARDAAAASVPAN